MESPNGLQHLGQPHGICIEHWPAPEHREAISRDIHDVDVRGPLSYAILDNARGLVDQGVDGARYDFIIGDFASHDASLGGTLRDELVNLRIWTRLATPSFVAIEPRARLLPITAHVAHSVRPYGAAQLCRPGGRLALACRPADAPPPH